MEQVLKYRQKMREDDPTVLLQSLGDIGPQMTLHRYGENLETLLYLCLFTGAIPYTYLPVKQRELELTKNNGRLDALWKPLYDRIAATDFKFLTLVDGYFVYIMKSKGLLTWISQIESRKCDATSCRV